MKNLILSDSDLKEDGVPTQVIIFKQLRSRIKRQKRQVLKHYLINWFK